MENIREAVKEQYASAVKNQGQGCCVGGGCCTGNSFNDAINQITGDLYDIKDLDGLDPNLLATSFGCGNPTALARLSPGEVVLDLGSGAGLDVILSAKRVGPTGKVYGLDMTDEMLEVARENQRKSGMENIEFLKGHIEEVPLPENTVDVIISNCVINLSADKDRVLAEAFRVLKPGGRFAVSDIVLRKPLPEKAKKNVLAWAGCIAGALLETEYKEKLSKTGFSNIELEITREYDLNDPGLRGVLGDLDDEELKKLNGSIVSAFIRASKPE